ncbi:FliH/SctL family protein [Sandarakinorhabdus sp. DWP1-3-1]|uniref:FliH/SctL family protein n=1 Tax=Sandarakinorhabdus sp. DWP1-3-1 TaxID=2804627 RepID=UPI003CEBA9A4
MSEGLAGLLSALQPRVEVPVVVPDLDAVRAVAFDAGFAAGAAEADAALAPLRDQLAAAAAAYEAACLIEADTLRPVLAALVRRMAETVLMTELKAGAAVLLPLVEAALAAVRPGAAATLNAHPDTLAALRPHLPDIATAADPALPPGSVCVTGTEFCIAVDIGQRLDDVLAGLA